jgi:hypothetical protein
VPVDSSFARQTKVKKEEEKQEQQVLKRLVLQYEQQVEEEYIEEDFPGLYIILSLSFYPFVLLSFYHFITLPLYHFTIYHLELTMRKDKPQRGGYGQQGYRGRGVRIFNAAQRGRGYPQDFLLFPPLFSSFFSSLFPRLLIPRLFSSHPSSLLFSSLVSSHPSSLLFPRLFSSRVSSLLFPRRFDMATHFGTQTQNAPVVPQPLPMPTYANQQYQHYDSHR